MPKTLELIVYTFVCGFSTACRDFAKKEKKKKKINFKNNTILPKKQINNVNDF